MTDFTQICTVCKESSAIFRQVADEFLISYAAQKEGLESEMAKRLKPFRPVIKKLEKSAIQLLQTQYIGHRIFKEEGLITKYLQHTAIRELPPEAFRFLEQQAATPWRFSYSTITGNPATDFFEMKEAFTGATYLLYSTSVSQILAERPVSLWFNLIGFNGACWQTYGPVTAFASYNEDDIFFFATELNPAIETDEALLADLENNPVPYTMLLSGAAYPRTMHGQDEMLQVIAEHSLASFDSNTLKPDCKIEYAQGIYRVSPATWSEPPHFAHVYYAEEKQELLLSALSDRGFEALVQVLNKHGFDLPPEPDIRLHLPMLMTIRDILGTEVKLNPYEEVFTIEPEPVAAEEMARLNRFMALALPIINSGREPDIPALAKEAGVDEQTAQEVMEHTMERISRMRQKSKDR